VFAEQQVLFTQITDRKRTEKKGKKDNLWRENLRTPEAHSSLHGRWVAIQTLELLASPALYCRKQGK
jgi:hypothetical protein